MPAPVDKIPAPDILYVDNWSSSSPDDDLKKATALMTDAPNSTQPPRATSIPEANQNKPLRSRTPKNSDDQHQFTTEYLDDDEEEVEFVLEPTPVQSDIDKESVNAFSVVDSEQTAPDHVGNGVTCRYFNRSRCLKGNSCPYSHAPDLYSLRSHPTGHNVCLYFLHNNKCRFKDQQCNYSHRRSDLNWTDEELGNQLKQKLDERKSAINSKKIDRAKHKKRSQATPTVPVAAPIAPKAVDVAAKPPSPTERKQKKKPKIPPPLIYPNQWDMNLALHFQRMGIPSSEFEAFLNYTMPVWAPPRSFPTRRQ